MKSFLVICALAVGAQACFQVHTSTLSEPLFPTTMMIQVRDNNVEVCRGSRGKPWGSAADEYCLEPGNGCNNNYRVCMTSNGHEGYVTNLKDKYTARVYPSSGSNWVYECGKNIHCTEFEYCLDDNFWNCNNYPYCKTCDGRGYCDW